jgi:hypothetical protein
MTRGGTESGEVFLFCFDADLAVICLAPFCEMASGATGTKTEEDDSRIRVNFQLHQRVLALQDAEW